MPATIQRLSTKHGTVYDMGKAWPGAPVMPQERVHDQLNVGPIFFVPGEERILVAEDDEEEGDPIGSSMTPAHYEIWCVTNRALGVFINQLRGASVPKEDLEQVLTQGIMTRRVVYTDQVSEVDEDWPAAFAFPTLLERYAERYKAEGNDDPKTEKPALAGNGQAVRVG